MKGRGTALGWAVVILAALLQALWAYPWFTWLGDVAFHWSKALMSLPGAAMFTAAIAVVSRYCLRKEWPLLRARVFLLVAAGLLLVALVGMETVDGRWPWDVNWAGYASGHLSQLGGALAFGSYLVWRGIVAGRDSPAFDDHYHKFLFGLFALVLVILLQGPAVAGSERGAFATVGLLAVAYFAAGLLLLALVRLDQARLDMRAEDAPRPFRMKWLAMAISVVLGIVALSLTVASLFSLDISAFLRPLGVIAHWLAVAAIYGVLYPLGLLATALLYAARYLAYFFGAQRPEPFVPPSAGDLDRLAQGQEAYGLSPAATTAIKWALIAGVVCLTVFLLYRALGRRRQERPEDEAEEISESIWSWLAFKKDLRSALAALVARVRRLRGRPPASARTLPAAIAAGLEDQRQLSVREIYRGLLWQGDRIGIAREPGETPYEYRGRIVGVVPDESGAVDLLTESYVAERYGERPAGADRVALLNTLWRRLRGSLARPSSQ